MQYSLHIFLFICRKTCNIYFFENDFELLMAQNRLRYKYHYSATHPEIYECIKYRISENTGVVKLTTYLPIL